jgi:hypothetical protein
MARATRSATGATALQVFSIALTLVAACGLPTHGLRAALITGTFATADATGSYRYDSTSPFALQDGFSSVYEPVSNGALSITHDGITANFVITEILVDPDFPDGHLGLHDVLSLQFGGGPFDQLQFFHTPAGTLPSYALADLDPSEFNAGFLFFGDLIGGVPVEINEPLQVAEPGSLWLLLASLLAVLGIAQRRHRPLLGSTRFPA